MLSFIFMLKTFYSLDSEISILLVYKLVLISTFQLELFSHLMVMNIIKCFFFSRIAYWNPPALISDQLFLQHFNTDRKSHTLIADLRNSFFYYSADDWPHALLK